VSFHVPEQPWSVAQAAARGDRDQLIRFWLAAPQDLLPSLWDSPLGQATMTLVQQLTPQFPFTPEQLNLRTALNQRLQRGLDQPGAVPLLLATFLLSPAGQFKIATPERWLPTWLQDAYRSLYEHSAAGVAAAPQPAPQPPTTVPQPDFGAFPSTLRELTGNRIQLNRMLGLSNLYYIDPEDQEILQELQQLRLQLVGAIERCPEQELEHIWSTDFGDRYWAMVRSGVQKEALSAADEQCKQRATERLTPSIGGGFQGAGAINAFLVAMLYYVPGQMKVDGAEQKLPAWLLPGYQEVFARPLMQAA
jgi:hypothetical protein